MKTHTSIELLRSRGAARRAGRRRARFEHGAGAISLMASGGPKLRSGDSEEQDRGAASDASASGHSSMSDNSTDDGGAWLSIAEVSNGSVLHKDLVS